MPASEVPYLAFTHIIHWTLMVANAQGALDSTSYSLTPAHATAFVSGCRAAGVLPIVGLSQLGGFTNFLTQTINAGKLNALVSNVMGFMNQYGYAGVDIDWEVDLSSNATNFKALVNALRAQLPRANGKILTATFGGLESIAAANYANLDQINLQCYDLALPSYGPLVWHNSALYNLNGYITPGSGQPAFTCDWRVKSFLAAGVPASKIGMGIPFYGYVWVGGTLPGQAGGNYTASAINYRDLVVSPALWQTQYMHRDPSAGQAPYLSIPNANQFVTYPDGTYIAAQWSYVLGAGLGGLMVFDLGNDWNTAGATMAARHPLAEALRIAAAGQGPIPVPPPFPCTITTRVAADGVTATSTVTRP